MYFLYLIASTQPPSQTIKAPAWFSSVYWALFPLSPKITAIPPLDKIPNSAQLDVNLGFIEDTETISFSTDPDIDLQTQGLMFIIHGKMILDYVSRKSKTLTKPLTWSAIGEFLKSQRPTDYQLVTKKIREISLFCQECYKENSRLEKALKQAFRQDIPEKKAEPFDQVMFDTFSKEIDGIHEGSDYGEIMANFLEDCDKIQDKRKEIELLKKLSEKLENVRTKLQSENSIDPLIGGMLISQVKAIKENIDLLTGEILERKKALRTNTRYNAVRAALLRADPHFFSGEDPLKEASPAPIFASPQITPREAKTLPAAQPRAEEQVKSEPKSFQEKLQDIQKRLDEIGKKLKEIETELNQIADKLKEIEAKLIKLQQNLIYSDASSGNVGPTSFHDSSMLLSLPPVNTSSSSTITTLGTTYINPFIRVTPDPLPAITHSTNISLVTANSGTTVILHPSIHQSVSPRPSILSEKTGAVGSTVSTTKEVHGTNKEPSSTTITVPLI